MPATVWSGRITFGLVSVPVKLMAATESHDISFHYLHEKDMSQIGQQYYCKEKEEVVTRDELIKGYEIRKGEYIPIEPEELEALEPESSSNLAIEQFIDISEVDPVYYERSYYVVPSEEGTEKAYGLLVEAMK